jgi:hypothetical protein
MVSPELLNDRRSSSGVFASVGPIAAEDGSSPLAAEIDEQDATTTANARDAVLVDRGGLQKNFNRANEPARPDHVRDAIPPIAGRPLRRVPASCEKGLSNSR